MDAVGKTLFRPSDVAVGADGAIYVSDWFDPRVGGHADLDGTCSGAIYRIAPKCFKPVNPSFDLKTVEGQVEALKSPAVNVRALGFYPLRDGGEKNFLAVEKLLSDPNLYIQARAVHLLAQLGPKGEAKVREILHAGWSEEIRATAYRALRRANKDVLGEAAKLTGDASKMLLREVALSLRDAPADQAVPILVQLGDRYQGDRAYLEAWGTGTTGKGEQVFAALKETLLTGDPVRWRALRANLVWRLMTPAAVKDLTQRAMAKDLDPGLRKVAIDSLAFIPSKLAGDALIEIAQQGGNELAGQAVYWLEQNTRDNGAWSDLKVKEVAVAAGVLTNEPKPLVSVLTPEGPPGTTSNLASVEEIAKLKGDPEKGKVTASRCLMCHQYGGIGLSFGPGLDGWAKNQTTEVIVRSILEPSADIAHGFDGFRVETHSGAVIDGLLGSKRNPAIILSQGGVMQRVPNDDLKSAKKLGRSLMLTAEQLGLTAQDIADITAYLKSL